MHKNSLEFVGKDSELEFVNVQGAQKSTPPACLVCLAGTSNFPWLRQPIEGYLSYRPARLHALAELIPWNRFLGS